MRDPRGQAVRPALFVILTLLAFSAGCSREVGRVGAIPITGKDLSRRAQVSEVYYPGSGERYVVLSQLIQGALSVEVMKSLGIPAGDAELEKEALRIEENTRDPERLKKIREIFGNDRRAYRDVYVRGIYAERVLFNEVFLKSRDIHQEQYRKAEAFLEAARKTPASFREVARKSGLTSRRMVLSPRKGILPEGNVPGRAPSGGEAMEQAGRLIRVVAKLAPGEVSPEVVEWIEGYQVVRLVRREGGNSVVESVGFPKRTYDDWFWETASRVPVKIHDKSLKEEFLRKVSWGRKLRLE